VEIRDASDTGNQTVQVPEIVPTATHPTIFDAFDNVEGGNLVLIWDLAPEAAQPPDSD